MSMQANRDRMTSTSFNVGLGDGSRLSSRVLRPPGGGHTDIFGGDPEPPRGRRLLPNAAAAGASQIGEPMPTHAAPVANGNAEAAPAPEPQPEAAPEAPAAPAPPSPREEAKPAPVAEPAKAEAPKRVRVPPGGFSSGLW